VPRHALAGVLAALSQAKQGALALAKENAAIELKGRQHAARALWRGRQRRPVKGRRKLRAWGPGGRR
jgi:hypothetical protein